MTENEDDSFVHVNEPEGIFDSILQDEFENDDEDQEELEYEFMMDELDISDDELEENDNNLLPEERAFVQEQSHRIPPVPEGKVVSPAMLNFIRTVTKAYRLCYFQFMEFVNNTDYLSVDDLGYCTRQNIDTFFRVVISKRTTCAAVNRRYVSAIQKFSNDWEERTGFRIDSPIVKKALSDAKLCRKRFLSSTTRRHVDAHKHRPTKHPSPSQELELLDIAWRDVRSSRQGCLPLGINFLISWNCAMQGFTRGDEVRRCRLPDLCHEINYGPWRLADDGLSRIQDMSSPKGIISLIQQPLNTKQMSNRAHAVGFFRHRDWRRCATSVIAFSIMARFRYMTHSDLESFFQIDSNGNPNWYKYFLIDWRSYHTMGNTFREFMSYAGVEYTKLTHVRKLGITRAHQLGADRENIILLSKHTTQRVDMSYLPELPYQAMLACAGYDVYRRQEYFLPRSYAQVPPCWINKIFPYLNLWRSQVLEMRGYDKGASAKSFVNNVLPHLAEIVIQDGMYLMEIYPEHPYCGVLQELMRGSGYENWAVQMRERIHRREHDVQVASSGNAQYDSIMTSSERTVHKVTSLEHRIDMLQSQITMLQQMLQEQQAKNDGAGQTMENQYIPNIQNVVTPIRLEAMHFRQEREDSTINSEQRTMISVEPMLEGPATAGRLPTLPPNIHKTVAQNMEYWLSHRLWEFLQRQDLSLRQLGWSLPVQLRFCRRRDIAKWVKTVGEEILETELSWENDGEVFLHVAKTIDEERGRKTVMKALNEFMDNSPLSWRIKRRRNVI